MSADLTAALTAADLIEPDYAGKSLGAVLPAAAAALGVDVPGGPEAMQQLGVPRADRVCVVLVDGMGRRMLAERAGHAPFLRGLIDSSQVLTVGYPSTTATSLGLFGTGRAAGRTGLAGYTVRNPATGTLANLISWAGAGPAELWQREPSIFSLVEKAGVRVRSVGPARFAGSGLTRAALHGSEYVPAESMTARADAAARLLREPGLVYLYWGGVDKVGHANGWQSAAWADALTEVDDGLARLARSMPEGTLLLVTADHGMVDVDHEIFVDVAAVPMLSDGVELITGEPRATYVHVADGGTEAVLTRWRELLGDRAIVVRRDEAIAAGWFGPVAEHVLPLIGDLVVAATGRFGVVDSRTQTPHSLWLRGMHGSLTPGEMQVPLLMAG